MISPLSQLFALPCVWAICVQRMRARWSVARCARAAVRLAPAHRLLPFSPEFYGEHSGPGGSRGGDQAHRWGCENSRCGAPVIRREDCGSAPWNSGPATRRRCPAAAGRGQWALRVRMLPLPPHGSREAVQSRLRAQVKIVLCDLSVGPSHIQRWPAADGAPRPSFRGMSLFQRPGRGEALRGRNPTPRYEAPRGALKGSAAAIRSPAPPAGLRG